MSKRKIPFKPEYCEMLLNHMRQGFSFRTFAEVIGVSFSTIYRWTLDYPPFEDARAKGETARQNRRGWKQ